MTPHPEPPATGHRPPATGHRPPAYLIVRLLLGSLLLVAAALKGRGLALDPFAEGSFLASPRLQIATIEVEVILGVWLLAGWVPRLAWVAALGMFSVLATVSLYLALAGQASCGCFGSVQMNPWLTFSLDVVAVAALAVFRPAPTPVKERVPLSQPLKIGLGACLLLLVASGAMFASFGSVAGALAWLRGESLSVGPAVSDVGRGERGELKTFQVQLTNRARRPIRVVGGTTDDGLRLRHHEGPAADARPRRGARHRGVGSLLGRAWPLPTPVRVTYGQRRRPASRRAVRRGGGRHTRRVTDRAKGLGGPPRVEGVTAPGRHHGPPGRAAHLKEYDHGEADAGDGAAGQRGGVGLLGAGAGAAGGERDPGAGRGGAGGRRLLLPGGPAPAPNL